MFYCHVCTVAPNQLTKHQIYKRAFCVYHIGKVETRCVQLHQLHHQIQNTLVLEYVSV